ncbi:MAG: hypothetical protein DRJ97_05565 [Thermoprotei archaeon]|nr:MAG: hypothetical protein DRJ97_05565 [Thermoprotei archaeon]
MTVDPKVVDRLSKIKGVKAVLIDEEDLYVYSREIPFKLEGGPKPIAVVKASQEALDEIRRVAQEEGLIAVVRGEEEVKPGVLLVDTFTTPDLALLDEEAINVERKLSEAREAALSRIVKAGVATTRRLSLAVEGILKSRRLEACKDCRLCTGYCTVAPFFDYVETWTSKGRILLIHGYTRGELRPTPKLAEVVYSCTLCGACYIRCLHGGFPGLETYRAIMAARKELAKEGQIPQTFKSMSDNIASLGNPFASTPDMRWMWLEELDPPLKPGGKADVLYWVGCTTGVRFPEVAKAVVELLRLSGVNFTVLGEREGCCGDPLFLAGLWDNAKREAEKVLKTVKEGGYSVLLTACAGCYHAFAVHYPELLGIELPCEVLHVSQLLYRLAREGELRLGELRVKVAYHDPCELGRLSGVYEEPRRALKSIPGLELVEPKLAREKSRCCGGGGGLWAYRNEVSMNAAELRLTRDIKPLGVDKLVTACPACYMNFKYTSIDRSIPIEVVDLAELTLEAARRA